jgi:hypothetical protein
VCYGAFVTARRADPDPELFVDPVVEAYKRDVDRTLLERNLRLTPEERLRQLMQLQKFAAELRRAGRAERQRT